jgi:hypothetical protein
VFAMCVSEPKAPQKGEKRNPGDGKGFSCRKFGDRTVVDLADSKPSARESTGEDSNPCAGRLGGALAKQF